MTTATGSVTNWLRALEQGNDDAAQLLWERYRDEMYSVARRRMRRLKQRDVVDEEDIIVSSFAAICMAARKGQLGNIANRNELWALMLVSIHRKIGQREQYAAAARRDHGHNLGQADRLDLLGSRLERLVASSPSPASELILAEGAEVMLRRLNDPDLRAVAVLRLAGHTNDEIATEMGFSRRTIQRMLSVIRTCWSEDGQVKTKPEEDDTACHDADESVG